MHMTHRHAPTLLFFTLLVAIIMSACSKTTPPLPNTQVQLPVKKSPTLTPTLAPTASPTTLPTAASTTIMLALDDTVPPGMLDQGALSDVQVTRDSVAQLWLGAAELAPEGEILLGATWIYALAAPFPTLADQTSLDDLSLMWHGHQHGPFATVPKLYVPENLVPILAAQLGTLSYTRIAAYQTPPRVETLWEENSWAILPFEALSPKLKVIVVEGCSPLDKDLPLVDYPLAFQFQLIRQANAQDDLSEETVQSVAEALQTTNRDPDKMTTLVMTGVTALVRATAYKMEEKGLTYPGRDIVEWLSTADLTHISNEVSFYENCPPPNPNSRMLLFCSAPKYIELFEFIGADIIELTGNHNNDSLYVYGVDVVPYSLDLYDQAGMAYFAGGRDLEEAQTPLLIDHNGNRLAFIGCNAPGPDFAWATDDHGGAAPCGDFQWMAEEIRQLRQEGYLPIATFQYYEDYYNFPESHHVEDFGRMAQAGAVIVNGSQAHRPKAMTFMENAFVDYGLGNLFFDQMGIIDDYGNQILQTRWEKIQRHTFYNGQHLSTEILTAILEDYAKPRPMTAIERRIFLEEIFSASGWNPR